MGLPFKYDFKVVQGASLSDELAYTVDDVAVDFTGATAEMIVRKLATDTDAVLTLATAGAAGITLGGAAGTATVEVTAAQSAALTPGVYVYDLLITYASGDVLAFVAGQFIVEQVVTR